MRNPVWPSSCVTPAGTSNELYTHTHTHARVLYKHRIHGKLGLQLSFRWVFKEKSKHVYLVPGYGGKTNVKTFRWDQRVCVCVFFPSILDIKFVGRTSRGHTGGRSHRIFNPPSFCGACLDFCREKDSAIPFPRRPWSRILCTNELIVLHPLGIFILVF